MALLPRWQYMTPEAKTVARRAGWSLVWLILLLGPVRALLGPWSLLLLGAALVWIWARPGRS
jgi:hypothetical protein